MAHPGGRRAGPRWPALLLSFAVPAVLVAGLLFLLVRGRGAVETAVAGLAGWLPVGYAFAAGMVASVNPCGVMLLPSYVLFQLGPEGEGTAARPATRLFKALAIGAMATAGFVASFGIVSTVVATGGVWLTRAFPYAGAVVGGLAEYTSMALGFRYLLLVAIALYALSAVFRRGTWKPQINADSRGLSKGLPVLQANPR